MSIPYVFNEKSISFFIEKQHTITRDHPNCNQIIEAILDNDPEAVLDLLEVRQIVAKATFGKVIIDENDVVLYKGTAVPDYLASRILSHYQESPRLVEPLIRFAEKLMENPNMSVRNDLYTWLERGKMPIYPDGDFLAYKVVRSDFTPVHRGAYGNDQSPGQIVTQPRETCNENRNDTCASGLHFCSYEYLPVFGGWNCGMNKVIQLKINPADVVAIPIDYNLSKGRTCRFEVVQEISLETLLEDFGEVLVFYDEYRDDGECESVEEAPVIKTTPSNRRRKAEKAVAEHNGNKTAAARHLGISRSTLYDWLKSSD